MARASLSPLLIDPVVYLLLLLLPFISLRCRVIGSPDPESIPGCAPARCGDTVVPYPFWLNQPATAKSSSSSFCGYPRMGLSCADNSSLQTAGTGTVGGAHFTVSEINTANRTVTVVHSNTFQNQTCPLVLNNLTSNDTPAFANPSSSSTDATITFYLNCTVPDPPPAGSVRCLSHPRQGKYSYALPTDRINATYSRLRGECERVVVVPVLRRALETADSASVVLAAAQIKDLMLVGFQVGWKPPELKDCSDCERSGGLCGYRNETGNVLAFFCHCQEGTSPTFCRDPAHSGRKGLSVGAKVGIGIGGICVGVIVTALVLFILKYRKRRLEKGNSSVTASFFKSVTPSTSSFGFSGGDLESSPGAGYYQTPTFTYDELEAATGGFVQELGDGGFGTVYKGKLKDGRVVAIKCLHENTVRRVQQFRNEIEILNRLRHQNLVTLYGCSSRDSPKLLLVYEFVPNGTVADHLHGDRADERTLTWSLRMSIAIETAAALSYLHAVKPQIIHRDVKTSNILLDSDFHVKVADFGLSRLFPNLGVTHVSTAPQGTPGYVDPEYHQCYQLTDKSDVYSFGVVLIELVSSMRAVDITRNRNEINLSNLAMTKISAGLVGELADVGLGYGSNSEVTRMAKGVCELAFRCLQQEREMRPTMHEVLEELKRIQAGGDCETRAKNGKKSDGGSRDDVYLLNVDSQAGSSPPFSPNTVDGTSWPSRSTTPNASC